jgi:hypothetical protein
MYATIRKFFKIKKKKSLNVKNVGYASWIKRVIPLFELIFK